jgi:hypothetical protein
MCLKPVLIPAVPGNRFDLCEFSYRPVPRLGNVPCSAEHSTTTVILRRHRRAAELTAAGVRTRSALRTKRQGIDGDGGAYGG